MSRAVAAGGRRVVVAFDCATDATAVALLEPNVEDGGLIVLGSARDESGARHGGGVLLPMVQGLLAEAGRGQEDIGALVVGTGPGTFTGVRIAVSTGRALALALGCPVFGVSTLDAIAAQAVGKLEAVASYAGPVAVAPVVDARRRQVFTAAYVRSGDAWRVGAPFAAAPDDVVGRIRTEHGPTVVVCAGAEALVGSCCGERGVTAPQAPQDAADVAGSVAKVVCVFDASFLVVGQDRLSGGGRLRQDLARACAPAGAERVVPPRAGEPGSPELVTPIYVRPPDADIHITKMRDPWGGS